MYERSAIVLEKYIENVLNLNKKNNLRENCKNYADLMEEIENYQSLTEREGNIIREFDEVARELQNIQRKQEKISATNQKLEEERIKIFSELEENSTIIETKLDKIGNTIDKNNEELKILKADFVKYLSEFTERQKERNRCEKEKRIGEAKHIEYIKKMREEFKEIDQKDLLSLKDFINSDKESIKKELQDLMLKNGKNERIKFNEEVIKKAIRVRMSIAEKEAECYLIIYDRTRRLLSEVENEGLKLDKYKKAQKGITVKLDFLNAEREYLAGFLDYERMTSISGVSAHKKTMEEACNNFELDIIQIDNLYQLVLLEIANKATKKAYKELYNKMYLKNIEDKEKNFEQEANNIKVNTGTLINSNYWRIEGIKNIYNVFQYQIETNFERDLSEYKIEEEPETEPNMQIEKIIENEIYIDDSDEEESDYNEEIEEKDEYDEYDDYDEYDEYEDEEDSNYETYYDEYNQDEKKGEKEYYKDDDDDDEYDEEDEYDEYDEYEEDDIEDNYDEYDEDDEDEQDEEDNDYEDDFIENRARQRNRYNRENFSRREESDKIKRRQSTKKHMLEDNKKDKGIFNSLFKKNKKKGKIKK